MGANGATFDPSLCALEPIQFPGAIQPHGALLAAIGEPPWLISHASANLSDILGLQTNSVLGQPLDMAVGETASRILRQAESYVGTVLNKTYSMPAPHGGSLSLQAHRTGRHICVDIERAESAAGDTPPITIARSILETFRQAASARELCEIAVDGLRAITGYDRVVAYQFAAQGHGTVIAEARGTDIEPVLGLSYPPSAIPAQARRQYLRNRVGSVADSRYQPVVLLADPTLHNGAELDLTHSALRSVSPIHREYMRNMGVASSLTIAVAPKVDLWGLLVCHQATPRVAGPETRAVADLVGEVVSLLVGRLGELDQRAQRQERSDILRRFIDKLGGDLPLPEALATAQADLLGIVDGTGALLRLAGKVTCIGRTPPPPLAESILDALLPLAGREVLAIDDLGARDEQFRACTEEASGALLLPLENADGDAILVFRPEQPYTILWGSDPAAPATVNEATGEWAAPTSFAVMRETVRGRSTAWAPGDLVLAGELSRAVEYETARRMRNQLVTEMQLRERLQATLIGTIQSLRISEGQLNAVEMRLERAQARAGIGSWELNVATGQILWSKELFRIRGVTPGDLDPTVDNTLPLTHPDDRRSRQRWLADLMAGASPGPYEGKIARPDGTVRLVRIEGGAVRGPDGMITHIAGTLQDITERRQVERQLAHAQKMEALGNLTGGMAHDFNNMLGVVMVNLELLKRLVTANAAAVELCGEALDGANRCADLIRSLLAFARRQPLHPERTDVNVLVHEIVRILRRTLGEHITLELDLDQALWPATVDAPQLEAALVNLATNARDAMPRGGRLDITTRNICLDSMYTAEHPDVTAGDYVLIEVSDTGSGIPQEIIGRVFDPFFTTKAPGTGTGLGLSMAFGFAKQSDGHLAVYSEAGLGTTFRLYLPRNKDGEVGRAAPPEMGAVVGRGETVLVVEDNMQLRRAAARQLIQLGYEVRESENGDSALLILSTEDRIDLLFTDVVMPGSLDGTELARKATQLRPSLPVLLTSGFPGWRAANASPMQPIPWTVLNKPYSRDKLARAVRELLNAAPKAMP
jgi:PAS domain S-box-containing protein